MNITIISDNIYDRKGSCAVVMANALTKRGCRVNVILPFYQQRYNYTALDLEIGGAFVIKTPKGSFNINLFHTKKESVDYYFVSSSRLFGNDADSSCYDDGTKTAVFCTAALDVVMNKLTDCEYIITNSANTALVPTYIKFKHPYSSVLRNIRCYHYINDDVYGIYDSSKVTTVFGLSPDERHIMISKDRINLTKAAVISASRVFVGENALNILYDHRDELHHTAIQFGFKIRKLRLGIDYDDFSPERDTDIHKKYSSEDIHKKLLNKRFIQKYLYLEENTDLPLIAIYPDRNMDIWHRYADELNRCDIQTIVISDRLRRSDQTYMPKKCICIQDKSPETLKNIFSGADFCIFGGLNSVCGNPSFISAAYGCVPILPCHRFFDPGFVYFNKLTLDGNGYTYNPSVRTDMMYTLWDALGIYRHDKKTFNRLQQNTMKKIFSASDSMEAVEKEAEKTLYSFI
ncbi:MAG: glycogen/starch synthase [Clostridia bacterium]|nr:glycogen/starch synthase [Clostridia bacterium]